jgi:hypothetical protein
MFEGFTRQEIKTQEASINLVRGGSSLPLSRQHDIPQNLPLPVRLALPHGEKAPTIDRHLAIFEQPDFPIS